MKLELQTRKQFNNFYLDIQIERKLGFLFYMVGINKLHSRYTVKKKRITDTKENEIFILHIDKHSSLGSLTEF